MAFIGLGSNLDEPIMQLKQALDELADLECSRLVQHSSLYLSRPMGPSDQPDYINAVAALETCLEPLVLLERLQSIEHLHQRTREQRWGPRTLDLDILLYDNRQINTDALTVPHTGIAERAFVLYPLAEVAPDLVIPGLGPLQTLLNQCPYEGIEKVRSHGG